MNTPTGLPETGEPVESLRTIINGFIAAQRPLEPRHAKILYDNLWDLYDSEPAETGENLGRPIFKRGWDRRGFDDLIVSVDDGLNNNNLRPCDLTELRDAIDAALVRYYGVPCTEGCVKGRIYVENGSPALYWQGDDGRFWDDCSTCTPFQESHKLDPGLVPEKCGECDGSGERQLYEADRRPHMINCLREDCHRGYRVEGAR